MPFTGYIIMDASPYNASFFGRAMPDFLNQAKDIAGWSAQLHVIGARLMGLTVLGHIGFVIHHQMRKKDAKVLKWML